MIEPQQRGRSVEREGTRFSGYAGLHRFVRGTPPRLEVPSRGQTCDRCGSRFAIWITDDWRWRLLSRSMRRQMLCVPCYRGAARRRR